MIKIKAHAKINLFLEITGRRPDGFHDLESVFARISLHDVVSVKKGSGGIKISVKDNSNLGKLKLEDNLVHKACREFFSHFGIEPAAEVSLEKNIPVGAGMGGGSSDCAAALKGLSGIYGVDPAGPELFEIAEKLGSDVPFFLSDLPFARCSGKGEKIRAIRVRASLPRVLVVWPDSFVSTKEVYGRFVPAAKKEIADNLENMASLIAMLGKEGKQDFNGRLFNRLEDAVLPYEPRVLGMKRKLASAGLSSLMSGSGSAVFALGYSGRKMKELFSEIYPLHKAIFLAKFS